MTQYKSIAGPIGLTAEKGQDYEDAVKKYAAIIDENAVGGWELLWIQQIPVTKLTPNILGVIVLTAIGIVIGVAIGVVVAFNSRGGVGSGTILIGIIFAVAGFGIGTAVCKNKVVEFFNMLIFAKKE
jgi:hypothetical protein